MTIFNLIIVCYNKSNNLNCIKILGGITMEKVVLEIFAEDKKLVDEIAIDHKEYVQVINARKFQGEPETIQLLITLSSIIIPSIATVIVNLIRAKKHISLKYKGVEVKGISEDTVVQILNELCKEKDN